MQKKVKKITLAERFRIARKRLPVVYVLVDMRGTILEQYQLTKIHTVKDPTAEFGHRVVDGCPHMTFYGTREYARMWQKRIRDDMTKECWNTWRFRVVRYDRSKAR